MRAGRAMTRPTLLTCVVADESDLAAWLGSQPSSRAASRTFFRVAAETPGLSFMARETEPLDTPASWATSAIVTLPAGRAARVMAGRPPPLR